jgi:nitrogen fixation/metabolism regulation signal transduction histidine kinase
MNFNRFNISIIAQILLIGLTSTSFFWTINQEYMVVTSFSLVIIWILQIAYLFYYIKKITRELVRFFQSIEYDDLTINFNVEKSNSTFKKLYKEFNRVTDAIQQAKIEKESGQHYFQNTVRHIATGLISFNQNGDIEICNEAALVLLKIKQLKHINDLEFLKEGFSDLLLRLKPNKTQLVKISVTETIAHEYKHSEVLQLLLKKAEFTIHNKKVHLVSFQNIRPELEHEEIDAWQRLIRVLTHEIMNSVSPITLLTSSLIQMFEAEENKKTIGESKETIFENSIIGLHAIRKRSKGLAKFVETYRSLTQIPKPYFTSFTISGLFNNIFTLMKDDLKNQEINFIMKVNPENLQITADEKLIEQVLINLIKNSMQALGNTKNPEISITADANTNLYIRVKDNGMGMSKEICDNIFVPFFTTKEKGSGIGLSLSRQIMRLHKGNITVHSIPESETVFTLKF